MTRKTLSNRVLFPAAGLLLIGAVFLTMLLVQNANVTMLGISVAGMPVGGLSYGELGTLLRQEAEIFYATPIGLVYPNGTELKIFPKELGLKVNARDTQSHIFSLGRTSSLVQNVLVQIQMLLFGKSLPYHSAQDQNTLRLFIEVYLDEIHTPARNASPIYNPAHESFS